MTYCAVKGCHNSSHNHQKHKKIPFHGFPSDPVVAALWIEKLRLNRKECCWKPTKYTKICSIHFDEKEKYITKGGLCKLRLSAVPTKELHISCTEGSQNSNDVNDEDLHDPLMLVVPELVGFDEVPKEANENADFEIPSTSSQEQQIIHIKEAQISNEPMSPKSDTDSILSDVSIFDTPREYALRKKLAKNVSLQQKQSKKIKTLLQIVRRLKNRNLSLKKNIINLRKKKFIKNGASNILSPK